MSEKKEENSIGIYEEKEEDRNNAKDTIEPNRKRGSGIKHKQSVTREDRLHYSLP